MPTHFLVPMGPLLACTAFFFPFPAIGYGPLHLSRKRSGSRFWFKVYGILASCPAEMYQMRPWKLRRPSPISSPTHKFPRRSRNSMLVCPPTKANGRTVPLGFVPPVEIKVVRKPPEAAQTK